MVRNASHWLLVLQQEHTSESDFGANHADYSDNMVNRAAGLFGAVLAALLPVLAIAALYAVKSMVIRIVLLGVFAVLFAASLWAIADAKLSEIFTATAT
jgi:hypothetical protein